MILHRLLKSHLLRAGVEDEGRLPGPVVWTRLLELLSAHYEERDEERRRLSRAQAEIRDLYVDLAAERYKLHSVITSLKLGLCALGADGSVLFMSPEAERLVGWTEEELSRQNVLDLLEPLTGAPLPGSLEELVGSGRRFLSERHGFRHKEGRTVPVSLALNPMLRDQAMVGAVLIFEPLTTPASKADEGTVRNCLSGLLQALEAALSDPLSAEARSRVEAAHDYARSIEVALEGGPAEPTSDLAGLKVLVLGSNPARRAGLRRQLVAWGACVTEAADGAGALEVLEEAHRRGRPLDQVVVDTELGGSTPEAFERRLKQHPALGSTPLFHRAGSRELLRALRALSLSSFDTDTYPVVSPLAGTRLRVPEGGAGVAPEEPSVDLPPAEFTVLVVQDSPELGSLVEDCVTELRQEFVPAQDGEEAWRVYCEEPVHVIVTGWLLPGITGGELCRRVREEAGDTHTSLIVLVDSPAEEAAARERGADACLSTPIAPAALRRALQAAFATRVPKEGGAA